MPCLVAGKPLVSEAAVGTGGQLTVYNHGQDVRQSLTCSFVIFHCCTIMPCLVAGKPLVSEAAVGTEGQLTVYKHGEDGMFVKGSQRHQVGPSVQQAGVL